LKPLSKKGSSSVKNPEDGMRTKKTAHRHALEADVQAFSQPVSSVF